jgi:hypothetical protein
MAVRLQALRARCPLLTRNVFFSGTHYRLSKRVEGLGKLEKKINALIGTRVRDLPACSIEPQPSVLREATFLVA